MVRGFLLWLLPAGTVARLSVPVIDVTALRDPTVPELERQRTVKAIGDAAMDVGLRLSAAL